MKGGYRIGSGRKKILGSAKKIQIGIKIQGWIVEWLSTQEKSRASIIEDALIEKYKLNNKKVKKMFYAESYGQNITEDIYAGGILMLEANSQPYCDLFRFYTKHERNEFVNDGDGCYEISAADAKKKHKEQFLYWNK